MRLALTVRYGYDEELIFAQQLGADAVIMRLPVEAAVASAELLSTAAVDPAESVAMQATSTTAAVQTDSTPPATAAQTDQVDGREPSAPAAALHWPLVAGSMPSPAPQDSTPLATVAYRAAACGLPLAGVELTGMPQDAGAWIDALRILLDSAAAAGVRRLFCAPPGCTPGAPESGASNLAATAGAPVRSTAPSRSRDRTAGPDPVPVMNMHPAAMLASVAPVAPVMGEHQAEALTAVAPVAAGVGVDIVVPVDRTALGRADKAVPGLRLEWVVGTQPGGPEAGPADPIAQQVRADTVTCVRFDGGGRLLTDSSLKVPHWAMTLAAAGYRGWLRAGTPPRLTEDDDWNPKGAAADLGYLRAVVQSLGAGRP